jgi:acetyl-CoA carboxylase biotin carboxylase subunit
MGDRHGNVMHLGERECSIQRRHQKVLEESPSTAVTPKMREKIGKQVVEALKKVEYSSAGTVELLLDENDNLYFIEMNARIQVEHPVTEMVSGVDLVKSQIRVAAGEKLEDVVGKVEFRGHAIECRINAEDPETFIPSAGRLSAFRVPGGPGIRVDTAAYTDGVIPPYYDSLVAKVIAHGRDRSESIARMKRALNELVIEGIQTTIPMHQRILQDADFVAGKFDTHFLDRYATVAAR